jgi:hypothetical protein
MAKRLSMTELTQTVRDAETITVAAFPVGPTGLPQDQARLERQTIAFKVILGELLDNEYLRDMSL